jgi:hypothetical protein
MKTESDSNNTAGAVAQERLVRCVWNNLAASLICTPLLSGITVFTYGLGGHADLVAWCAAALGLSVGWMAGLCGVLVVISSPNVDVMASLPNAKHTHPPTQNHE